MARILLPPKMVAASLVVATELREKTVMIRNMPNFIVAPRC
jgi:hypothetical protein